jgi:hypothetical protein
MLFVNMQGFKVKVVLESDQPGGASDPPPAPKLREEKDDEGEELDEDEWDGRRGKHEKTKGNQTTLFPPTGSLGGNTGTSQRR